MEHWKKRLEPYASQWQAILDHAQRGLIHGMKAHEILCSFNPHHGTTADTASFLRDMVEAEELVPVAKDWAGAGHSVRAFRGLQGLRETKPPQNPDVDRWLNGIPCEASDAHLWTFKLKETCNLANS
jgi:hypothetical protein